MYRRLGIITLIVTAAVAGGCGAANERPAPNEDRMNTIAQDYVKLVLAVGQHDADFVDAYYGPAEWRKDAETANVPLATLLARARQLATDAGGVAPPEDDLVRLRHSFLRRQLEAVTARLRMLQGERLSFDAESQALYDAVAPTQPESAYQEVLTALDKRFPGSGPLVERYESFRRAFVVPRDKLDHVFTTAIAACRERTSRHLRLPEGESFTVEYVTGKSWSGYNWYQGNVRSLIQVNTDLPIYIDRAIDLACHEGYPGHHVYNALLEKHLVKDRGWTEFTVYPLFSPQSLIAEGTANYGIEVAFPGGERVKYEQEILFPAAGLDASRAPEYYEVQKLVSRLEYAGNEAARRYLDGAIDARQAADFLEKYALMPRPRAEQRVRFFDQYRSYVINYNLGKDMVRAFVEGQAGGDAQKRWAVFERLLSSPRLPSGLH